MFKTLVVTLPALLAGTAALAAEPVPAPTSKPLHVAKRLEGPTQGPAAQSVALTGIKLADVSGLPDPPRAGIPGKSERMLTGVPMTVAKALK